MPDEPSMLEDFESWPESLKRAILVRFIALADAMAKSRAVPRQVLTIEDLTERWSVSLAVVHRHIDEDGLQFFPLGRASGGKRPIYRFRLADVERWEQARVRAKSGKTEADPIDLSGIPAGWDGIDRTRKGRQARARESRNAKR